NKKTKDIPNQKWLNRATDVYYGMTLHTTGAAPAFFDYSTAPRARVEPPNYFGTEYQRLFDILPLNRHPREDESTRNWRYSQYRAFTKDPFIRIIEMVGGAIFQDSNYTLELPARADNAFVWGNNFAGYDIIGFFAKHLK